MVRGRSSRSEAGGEVGRLAARPQAQRGEIDERLEGRAGLPSRLHDAVELALPVVAASDHRADLSGAGVERHDRSLEPRGGVVPPEGAVLTLQTVQPACQRALGGPLQDGIERRVDPEPARRGFVGRLYLLDLPAHPVREVRSQGIDHGAALDDQALLAGLGEPLVVEHLKVAHLAQDHVAPLARPLRMLDGRIGVRRPDDPGERGGLPDRDPLDVLAEEAPRGRRRRRTRRTRRAARDRCRSGRRRGSRPWSSVARARRRSRASRTFRPQVRLGVSTRFLTSCWVSVLPPWASPPRRRFTQTARATAAEVDPGMLEEAVILGGQHGLDEVLRHGRERDRDAGAGWPPRRVR